MIAFISTDFPTFTLPDLRRRELMRVECAIRRGGEVSQICFAAFGLRRDKKVSNDLLRADSLSYFASSDSQMRDAKRGENFKLGNSRLDKHW